MMDALPHIGFDQPECSASDDVYDAALATLLACAVQPPSMLSRLRFTLMRIHALNQAELERLPLEYWYFAH